MKKIFTTLFILLLLLSCKDESTKKVEVDENSTKDTNIIDNNKTIVIKDDNNTKDDTNTTKPTLTWYKPDTNTTWQWQLTGTINTSYDVDVYDIDLETSSKELIEQLHKDKKKVICYFSGGSYEDYRDDKDLFPQEILGKTLDGWEDEKWLDIRSEKLKAIMKARLDLAKEKKCDGVEPDNMDGYTNDTGFALSYDDQIRYNTFIANEAHKRNLSVALKNDLDQINDLVDLFDFALNEQCHEYNECDTLKPFIEKNKAVFIAEYKTKYKNNTNSARDNLCESSNKDSFKTLVLHLNLNDKFRFSCFGK